MTAMTIPTAKPSVGPTTLTWHGFWSVTTSEMLFLPVVGKLLYLCRTECKPGRAGGRTSLRVDNVLMANGLRWTSVWLWMLMRERKMPLENYRMSHGKSCSE